MYGTGRYEGGTMGRHGTDVDSVFRDDHPSGGGLQCDGRTGQSLGYC